MPTILCTGEVLWDDFGERQLLGGAPLNFSAQARRFGETVYLLTAVGDDPNGHQALAQIQALGLPSDLIQVLPGQSTGRALVSANAAGDASFVIERPAAYDRLQITPALLARIQAVQPSWIYFGTLAQTEPRNEQLLRTILESTPGMKRFYDMNLREGQWNLPLVQRLSHGANLLKLNDAEAHILHRAMRGTEPFSLEQFCRHWSGAHDVETICVTLGSQGCAVFAEGRLQTFAGFKITVVDTVGAGDAFAAAFLHGVLQGWATGRKALFANAVGAVIASQAGAIPDWSIERVEELLASRDLQNPSR